MVFSWNASFTERSVPDFHPYNKWDIVYCHIFIPTRRIVEYIRLTKASMMIIFNMCNRTTLS